MPRVPKWLADTMEKVSSKYFHPVTVTHTEYYTPQLKLVRLEGELNFSGFVAANVVEFRVSDTDYRHYTPSLYDPEKKICEIIFYLHDQGVGSKWAENLKNGDTLKLMGPGGKMSYQPEYKKHFVFGDETSLGLMVCMEQAIRKNNQHYFGLAELNKEHLDWVQYLNFPETIAVESSFEHPAKPSVEWLNRSESVWGTDKKEICFYLTGRAKSIQQLRKNLIEKGIDSRQIKTYPYWAEGKKGL